MVKGNSIFLLALVLPAAALASGNIEDCNNGVIEQGNPLGTCACDGHLWVAPGCQEGFFCYDTQANGCHITCPSDQILYTNFASEFWECRYNTPPTVRSVAEEDDMVPWGEVIAEGLPDTQAILVCPFNGYDVCPSDIVATTPFPPDEADGNPLGTCRCDGELWLAEGCKYGFLCDAAEDIGGQYLSCPNPDEVVHIWASEGTWNCSTQTENCYGGPINGIGCTMPECNYAKNPFGECGCEEQFFINDDCSAGFWCSSNIPDQYLYDGCYQECYGEQILVPDFENKAWACVDDTDSNYCPGEFYLECDPISNFDQYDCDCPDGQLMMSGDCKESFWCRSRSIGGGNTITCPNDGEIVSLDIDDWNWQCAPDNGNCPGLGGFKVGCNNGGNVGPPDLDCNFGMNPYGECQCETQLYINEDCTKAFYCSEHIPSDEDPDFNGCQLSCEADERINWEPDNAVLECITRESDYICPGQFAIDCPDTPFNVQCNCDNEIWMNEDCSQIYVCDDERNDGTFDGYFMNCPAGEFFQMDLNNILSINCTSDPIVCPGSLHFGCIGGDIGDILNGPEDCVPLKNPFGTCECEGQLFIGESCLDGFLCTNEVDDPILYDGCYKTCPLGQSLQPDFINKSWACVDDSLVTCIGAFNLECEATGPFDVNDCDCPTGQLFMNGDCTQSFFCRDRFPNGGVSINCDEPGEIVSLNFEEWRWQCEPDNGNCPGLGGFKVGCDGSGNVTPPPLQCDFGVNPYGDCDCESQVYINEDCTKGFYCSEFLPDGEPDGTNGCQLSCEADERVKFDPDTREWTCITRESNYVCPGEFSTDCPGTPFDVNCNCDNELWMNEDCSRAYFCNSERPDGTFDGVFMDCPAGETWDVSLDDVLGMTCSSTPATCPGSYHFGCEGGDLDDIFGTPEECIPSKNPYGVCECNEQFFISDQCTEGFYCTNTIDDPLLYDGCYRKCPTGQVLQPDFENKSWACVDESEQDNCPGAFKLECEDTGNFDVSVCDCPTGQLHMNGDCTESFYCRDKSPNGGVSINCDEPGEIVSLNFKEFSWQCSPDTGNCPGLGGFKVGCDGTGNVTPEPIDCDFGTNPYGECDCEAEIYINEDCTRGFYCSEFIPAGEADTANGCQLSCQNDERVQYDPQTGDWNCITRESDYVCPGEFGTTCPGDQDNIRCNCDNELWMNDDCSQAYVCNNEREEGVFDGYFLTCESGEFWDISLDNVLEMECSTNPAVCHGGFHFGCEGGDIGGLFPDATTEQPDPTVTPPEPTVTPPEPTVTPPETTVTPAEPVSTEEPAGTTAVPAPGAAIGSAVASITCLVLGLTFVLGF